MKQPMPVREIKNVNFAIFRIQSNNRAAALKDVSIGDGEQYPMTGN
jgi:hypothetical protein